MSDQLTIKQLQDLSRDLGLPENGLSFDGNTAQINITHRFTSETQAALAESALESLRGGPFNVASYEDMKDGTFRVYMDTDDAKAIKGFDGEYIRKADNGALASAISTDITVQESVAQTNKDRINGILKHAGLEAEYVPTRDPSKLGEGIYNDGGKLVIKGLEHTDRRQKAEILNKIQATFPGLISFNQGDYANPNDQGRLEVNPQALSTRTDEYFWEGATYTDDAKLSPALKSRLSDVKSAVDQTRADSSTGAIDKLITKSNGFADEASRAAGIATNALDNAKARVTATEKGIGQAQAEVEKTQKALEEAKAALVKANEEKKAAEERAEKTKEKKDKDKKDEKTKEAADKKEAVKAAQEKETKAKEALVKAQQDAQKAKDTLKVVEPNALASQKASDASRTAALKVAKLKEQVQPNMPAPALDGLISQATTLVTESEKSKDKAITSKNAAKEPTRNEDTLLFLNGSQILKDSGLGEWKAAKDAAGADVFVPQKAFSTKELAEVEAKKLNDRYGFTQMNADAGTNGTPSSDNGFYVANVNGQSYVAINAQRLEDRNNLQNMVNAEPKLGASASAVAGANVKPQETAPAKPQGNVATTQSEDPDSIMSAGTDTNKKEEGGFLGNNAWGLGLGLGGLILGMMLGMDPIMALIAGLVLLAAGSFLGDGAGGFIGQMMGGESKEKSKGREVYLEKDGQTLDNGLSIDGEGKMTGIDKAAYFMEGELSQDKTKFNVKNLVIPPSTPGAEPTTQPMEYSVPVVKTDMGNGITGYAVADNVDMKPLADTLKQKGFQPAAPGAYTVSANNEIQIDSALKEIENRLRAEDKNKDGKVGFADLSQEQQAEIANARQAFKASIEADAKTVNIVGIDKAQVLGRIAQNNNNLAILDAAVADQDINVVMQKLNTKFHEIDANKDGVLNGYEVTPEQKKSFDDMLRNAPQLAASNSQGPQTNLPYVPKSNGPSK